MSYKPIGRKIKTVFLAVLKSTEHYVTLTECCMFEKSMWQPGLCSTHFFELTRLWLIWQSRWLNSDSTQIPTLLTWLNSDSTQNPNLTNLTQFWLNSFESELSQIWLTTHHILPDLGKSCWRGGGGAVECSCMYIGWFFLCKVADNCKILTFSPRKKNFDLTLTQAVSSWLNSDSNDDQRDSTLTRLISLLFTADSTLTRLIWVRVESNLTDDSWVEHNPGGNALQRSSIELSAFGFCFLICGPSPYQESCPWKRNKWTHKQVKRNRDNLANCWNLPRL